MLTVWASNTANRLTVLVADAAWRRACARAARRATPAGVGTLRVGHFEAGARFLRVTGSDLFLEETLSYRPDDKSVIARTIGSAANAGEKLTKRHIA